MILDLLKNFKQENKGDLSGSIWATKNIDPNFNNGKINIGKVIGFSTHTTDQTNLGLPASGFAFTSAFTTDRYFAVADDRVWKSANTNPISGWTEVSSTPTDCDINSDIIAFNSKIYIATTAQLRAYTQSGGFTVIAGGLGNDPHSFTVFANRLYISDLGEKVHSMTTGEVFSKATTSGVTNTIDLNTVTGISQIITKIEAVSNGIWIATSFSDKAGGEMIFWDGVTANIASNRYKLSRGAMSMTIKNDRPYIVDSLGRLRVFDGTSFTEIARLPIIDEAMWGLNDGNNDRFIHPNGMITANNDEIYFLLTNRLQDTAEDEIENMPSGIWAWNKDYGLYHKYSFSDIQFSTTSTTGTLTDYGASELSQTGALFRSDATGGTVVDRNDQSEVLAGVTFFSDATTTVSAFAVTDVDNDIQKAGYLVTKQVQSEAFDETWKEVIAVYDKLKNSTDRIVVKYRTSEDTPIYGTGSWSSDSILRSTADLSSVKQGDEVEILRGKGSGLCSHIDDITGNYRMQLDENQLSGMSGTCGFRIQTWKKVGTENTTDQFFIKKSLDAKAGSWVQFKVYMVGTGKSPQLQRLISNSTSHSKFN